MAEMTLIGKGMTSEIFSLDDGKVLKLYYAECGPEMAEHEARISQSINGTGVAPGYHGKMQHNGRIGLIYDRISGYELMADFMKPFAPLSGIVKKMAGELYAINCVVPPETLIRQKDRLRHMIGQSEGALGGLCVKVTERLSSLDTQSFLCHGDYHPGNIMCSGGEYVAIDWMNAYAGNPLSDAVRTWLMFASPFIPNGVPPLLKPLLKAVKPFMANTFRNEYLRISKEKKRAFEKWIPVMAAARLIENIPGEKEWLFDLIKRYL